MCKTSTGDCLSGPGVSSRFRRAQEGEFSRSRMGRVFGLARSGSYAWKKPGAPRQRDQADNQRTEQIRTAFPTRQAPSGRPRSQADWQAPGVVGSRQRGARLRRPAGFRAALPRHGAAQPPASAGPRLGRRPASSVAGGPHRHGARRRGPGPGWRARLVFAPWGRLAQGRPPARRPHPSSPRNGDPSTSATPGTPAAR